MSKRMKLIFTVSLLLNIILIGVGAGMLFRFCQDIPIPADMSPEARHFVAMTFQNGREQVKPLIDDVKAKRKVVEMLLTADAFDAKAYGKAVDDLLETQAKIARKRADIMEAALQDLPAADRKKFADRILDGLRGGRPRKGGYHRDMGKDDVKPPLPPGERRP